MPKDTQSIEDLMKSSDEPKDSETVQGKFNKKQIEIKTKETERLTEQEANDLGISYVNLASFPISPEAIALIEETQAQSLKTICFYYDGLNVRLGSVNPQKEEVKKELDRIKEKYHVSGNIYFISDYSLDRALKIYKNIPKTTEHIKGVKISEEELDKYSEQFSSFRDLQEKINSAQISDIVTIIMAAAIKSGSSDMHIETEEKEIKVRLRIDGVLHDIAILDHNLWQKIVSRLKGLSGVKINISNKPQDGRISIFTKKERIDIRVSFLPTNYGESVVMRLLRSGTVGLTFEDLGIRNESFIQLKKEVERPNGMIITTGPTGSGKTTTLYAILKKLNKPETKIITIEDPIEYQLNGVNQSQISKEYTFAKALRSIVRQDPDVIMVGEIRDLETAEIAIQAALTGHMVLSTIHTNDAAGAIPRFLSMGSKPFLLAPAINAIVGQRLVRRLCEKCKKEAEFSAETSARAKEILEKLPEADKKNIDLDNLKFYKNVGCPACQEIGYKGRIGIYEILIMNKEIEKLILSGQLSEYDIRDIATKNGMVTMVQDGLLKALEGITSAEEIFRVAE